ncbi:hypothetical protein DICPUDRAFT_91330 [Dictyostelium purpureum]|uniref:Tetraspanin n=1 Tax=Dictyostelium purpureum TaxID=5786 RepID=F0ZAR8_DICPU|nr:uncharacterized protein DICPUDRAFT_91330 [Dictyostelium purpureum]EGC38933.1 hypothetical protein DICPUDRAFT_91330 [Dictyostelium purpureum]|eukprot:XP_003284498.1 hypothetical protein DICPUDRAFT_91330 [Dictyostelium purpureum]
MANFSSDLLPQTPRYLKVPLIFLNSILWILGLVLLVMGAFAVSFFSNFKDFTNAANAKSALSNLTTSAPAGILVIGIFFVILTIAGCYVAYREKLVGLVIYTLLMLVLLVALIGVGGKALTLKNDDILKTVGQSWYDVSNGPKNSTITKLEEFLGCCRWNSSDTEGEKLCPKDKSGVIKTQGFCDKIIESQIPSKLYLVGASGVAIGVIELVCMLFSLFLIIRICRSPRSKSYDQY